MNFFFSTFNLTPFLTLDSDIFRQLKRNGLLAILLSSISCTNLIAQFTNSCGYIGTPITVGTSCNPVAFNSTANTDYWNSASGCSASDMDDAWWWFTAISTSTTISYNSGNDAVLHVFTGGCSTTMTHLACADDFGAGGTETINMPTTIGQNYAIRIQRYLSNNSMNGSICVYSPAWQAEWVSMNTGSSNWCAGETRNVSVTVKNIGATTWTDATPDINIGVKWNNDADYFIRTDATNLTPGATQTYWFTVTAPMTSGIDNLSFDVVNENNFWFADNWNGGGPGNTVFTSPAISIQTGPTVNAGSDVTVCNGQLTNLSATASILLSESLSPNMSISDNSTIFSSLTLSNTSISSSQITGVNVNISHTWDSDLTLTLIAPDGSSIVLSSNNGGSGDNYINTYFGVSGNSITTGSSPFTGNFTPQGSFSSLTGAAAGTWTLQVSDGASGDVGVLENWSIDYMGTSPLITYDWTPFSSLNNSTILNPTATPILPTTYTFTATFNGCSSSDQVLVNMPNPINSLSQDTENSTCIVNQNGWVHFHHSSGRLIGSINSNGQDLGNVTITSYVDPTNALVPACSNLSDVSLMTNVLQRHWVITPTIQPTMPVEVKLPFTDQEYLNLNMAASLNYNGNDDVNSISDLLISKYDGSNINSDALDNCSTGTTVAISPSSNGATGSYSTISNSSYLEASVASFSEFWIHGSYNLSPLPVELIHFNAECHNKNETLLTWSTFSETNCDLYEIKKSKDGENWEIITTIKATGTNSQITNYTAIDSSENRDLSYYKLIQFDIDGLSHEKALISSECHFEDNYFSVDPNPFKDEFEVNYSSSLNGVGTISLLDQNGRIVFNKTVTIHSGLNTYNFDGVDFMPGIYFLVLQEDSKNPVTRKVIITN